MGSIARAALTYGYDVTSQSPDWHDNEDLDDIGEYGTRILHDAQPGTIITLVRNDHTGLTILAAASHHNWAGDATEIDSLELPPDAGERLAAAAAFLDYDLTDQAPVWRLTSDFS
jgi:hypothetical protein